MNEKIVNTADKATYKFVILKDITINGLILQVFYRNKVRIKLSKSVGYHTVLV